MKKFAIAVLSMLFWQGLYMSASIAQTQQAAVQGTYVCETADGKYISSDRPIRECFDREQRIISSNGTTIAIIRPASEIRKEEEAAAQQAKHDQMRARLEANGGTLLAQYPTAASHDEKKQAHLQPLLDKLDSANQQIELSTRQLAALDKTTPMKGMSPAKIQEDRERLTRDISVHQHISLTLRKQIASICELFDEEKAVLAPMWQKTANSTTAP